MNKRLGCTNFRYRTAETLCVIPKFKKLATYNAGYCTTMKIVEPEPKKYYFSLIIYPCGFNERSNDYISVWLKKKSTEELVIEFTCAVVNAEDREIFRRSTKQNLALESAIGWTTFYPRQLVLDAESNVLKDGKLTLVCKLEIFESVAAYTDDDSTLRSLSKMSDNFRNLLLDASQSDFTLRVGTEHFPVHKTILSARSPVFKSMISQGNGSKEIEVNDVSSEGMKVLLCFIYTGELGNLSVSISLEVYSTANKFGLLSLKCLCSKILVNRLNIDNVIQVLVLAHKHCDLQLLESCLGFMDKNLKKIKEQLEWIELMRNFPDLADKAIFFHELKSISI